MELARSDRILGKDGRCQCEDQKDCSHGAVHLPVERLARHPALAVTGFWLVELKCAEIRRLARKGCRDCGQWHAGIDGLCVRLKRRRMPFGFLAQ